MSSNYFSKASITKPAENIICILAPNPSPMTFKGTNTYIIDNDELAIIDPGPINEQHFNNILEVTAGRPVKYIFLTHSHVDHSPLAKQLSVELKAPIYGYGASDTGLSSTMLSLIDSGYESGSEGIDYEFTPDYLIRNNQKFELNNTPSPVYALSLISKFSFSLGFTTGVMFKLYFIAKSKSL